MIGRFVVDHKLTHTHKQHTQNEDRRKWMRLLPLCTTRAYSSRVESSRVEGPPDRLLSGRQTDELLPCSYQGVQTEDRVADL